MIYLVTNNPDIHYDFTIIDVETSLTMLKECKVLQYDSETSGLSPHLKTLICIQLGSDEKDFRIVIDTLTVDILHYKEILENTFLIGHNLKFDLQFLFNYEIIPRKLWDTFIIEQLLHLGYPKGAVSFSLQQVAYRYIDVYIDKEIRSTISDRLNKDIIIYAANDVTFLEQIAKKQKEQCIEKECLIGAVLENNFVPACAYLEWCGIKLDEDKWKAKMKNDEVKYEQAKKDLDDFVTSNPKLSQFTYTNLQDDLFEEVSFEPECIVNWDSPKQVVPVFATLGFDTKIFNKEEGKEKDTVIEKHLNTQKHINPEFVKKYLDYKEFKKKLSSFGQKHINSINPITGRLYTNYNQLGTVTGRMSSGGGENKELALYKQLPSSSCIFPNMQQLPNDHETRACFVSEKGKLFCSVDYDGMEARLGAVVYNEKHFIEEFLYGSGDLHSVWAKYAFPNELKDMPTKDIKKLRPDLRQKAKGYGFEQLQTPHIEMYV